MRETITNALALRLPDTINTAGQTFVPAPPLEDEGTHLRDYWRSIRKRLWMVLGVALLVTTLATIALLRRGNVYEATARVQVDLENVSPVVSTGKNGSIVVNNATNDPAYFNTQLQILTGPGLMRRTVKSLDLERNTAFTAKMNRNSLWRNLEQITGMGGAKPPVEAETASQVPMAQLSGAATHEDREAERLAPYVELLQRNLRIEPVKESRLPIKETRLIEITYTTGDPRLAARVVNTIADAFAASNLDKKTQTNNASGEFLEKRIAELQASIRTGEEELIAYGKTNQILSLDASQNTVVDRLTGLNKQLLEAENERKLAEASYRAAQLPGAASALAAENAKTVEDAEQKLADLQQRRAQLLVVNTEEWPEVKEINQQINVLQNKVVEMRGRATAVVLANLQTRYRQGLTREESLRSAFNQQRGETLTQNEAAINYRIIQQEIETNKNLLDGLLQRAKENDVVLAGTPNNISVADYAITPRQPIGPQRLLGVMLAFVIAIVFGMCLAIFLEYLDNSVRSADEVERRLHLPVLAVIPAIGGVARRRLKASREANTDGSTRPELLTSIEAHTSIAEPYKQLRTSILLSTAGRAPKTLLVTSANPGEGKTTTTINTAISLAQTGARVLVIDADMRRPTVHTIFDIRNVAGLSTALSRDASRDDVLSMIERDENSGLFVLTSGPIPPNPAELIGSVQMRTMLSWLEDDFDYVVIDSPPVATVTDGVLLASMVDGVILVVHGGKSSRELVRRARQLLLGTGARIFGVVLNNVRTHKSDYYQGYYGKAYVTAETTAAV